MQPNIHINWISIIVATVLAFGFGGFWYGPLFGKRWGKLMGFKMDQKPNPKVMRKAFLLQFLGLAMTSYVLSYSVSVWRPSVWGLGTDSSNFSYGMCAGVITWLGFYVPMQLSKVAWEQRGWSLFLINSFHDFFTLQIITQVLANFR